MKFAWVAALLMTASAAAAEGPREVRVEGTFDDVAFAVENAVIGAGLVIDGTHDVGEMLARTKADVGGTKDLYIAARVLNFCSAVVSRQVMERDLGNIRMCPYGVFVYEAHDAPGTVVVGRQDYTAMGAPEVDALLDGIIDAATQ